MFQRHQREEALVEAAALEARARSELRKGGAKAGKGADANPAAKGGAASAPIRLLLRRTLLLPPARASRANWHQTTKAGFGGRRHMR